MPLRLPRPPLALIGCLALLIAGCGGSSVDYREITSKPPTLPIPTATATAMATAPAPTATATPTPSASSGTGATGGSSAADGLDQFCADNPGACDG